MTKAGKGAGFWYVRTSPGNSTAFQHKNAGSLSLPVLTLTVNVTHFPTVSCLCKAGQVKSASLYLILIFVRPSVLDSYASLFKEFVKQDFFICNFCEGGGVTYIHL